MGNEWHYARQGKQLGPVSAAELKHLAAGGQIAPTDMVWKDGMAKWASASSVSGLFDSDAPPPSSPPPYQTPPSQSVRGPTLGTAISLLPGERVVMSSNKDILTVTTKRVRYNSTAFGSSSLISITLDSIASCGLVTKSFPILLLLGAAAFVAAFTQRDSARQILFVVAVVLAVIYFVTRRAVISIASNGGETIIVPATGMSRDSLIEFVEAVEREKLLSKERAA